jgi:hypothetical protein
LGEWHRLGSRTWQSRELDELHRIYTRLLVIRVNLLKGEFPFVDEPRENFEEFGRELQFDFEPYYPSTEAPDMKLLRSIKNFLCKERSSPFCLNMPSDFAVAQWGI